MLMEEDAESWGSFRTVPTVPQEDTTPGAAFPGVCSPGGELGRPGALVPWCPDPGAWGQGQLPLWRSYPVNVDVNSMLWEMVAFILMISSLPSNIN